MTCNFANFKISAYRAGEKAAPWSDGKNWNHHRVTVTNAETRRSTSFSFWASIAHPQLSSEYDVINAFRCFVDDAICGNLSFSEFCDELGYDEDSRKAYSTWNACKRHAEQLTRIYGGDLYELINSMEEYA